MILLAVLLPDAAFLHFLPSWTRPGMFFGVTVDPAFRSSPAAAHITRVYRLILWCSTLSAAALILTGHREFYPLQVIGYFCALAVTHRRALPYAVPVEATVEVNLSAARESFPGGPFLLLLPHASLAAFALWISRHWDRLPARFPVHWGVHGADRWALTTPSAVYGLLAQEAFFSLIFVLMAVGIFHWSRRVSTRNSVGAEERRFRRINAPIFLVLACVPAVQPWIILLRTPATIGWSLAAALAAFAVYFAVIIPNRPRLSSRSGDLTPDRCWKLGVFYFNPADPAVFVLQRFGIGYTFNFGNRWTWAGVATVLLAVSFRATLK